jgi:hypothetical protein
MRIIIEDSGSVEHAFSSIPFDSTALEDGGPAPGQLVSLLRAGAPARLGLSQEGELQDAGPPPAWLVEAVEKAYQQAREQPLPAPAPSSPGFLNLEAADGGRAPDLPGG